MKSFFRLLVPAAVVPLVVVAGAVSGGGVSDASAAIAAPNTMIHAGPTGTVSSRTARFHLKSTQPGRIQCKLDRRAWRVCVRASQGPVAFTGLSRGYHTLRARAVNRAGRVDPTPARRTWRIR